MFSRVFYGTILIILGRFGSAALGLGWSGCQGKHVAVLEIDRPRILSKIPGAGWET